MMVRALFVSSLLFYSTVTYSQTPAMFWASEPVSYGTEMDAVVSVAKANNVALPTEYTLRSLQRLIDDLKTAGHWTNIKVLHCFEHDGSLTFSKINLKNPSQFGTNGLYQNNGIGANSDIEFLRNVGIRNKSFGFEYYTINHTVEANETVGVVIDANSMLSASTGPIIGVYTDVQLINTSVQYRHTYLAKLSSESFFRGIKHSDYTSPSSMLSSSNLGSNTLTRTLSLSRSSTSISLGVNGGITSATSTLYNPTASTQFYTIMGYVSTFLLPDNSVTYQTYSGINYIKFAWVSTNSITSIQLHSYFENYSSWIPN